MILEGTKGRVDFFKLAGRSALELVPGLSDSMAKLDIEAQTSLTDQLNMAFQYYPVTSIDQNDGMMIMVGQVEDQRINDSLLEAYVINQHINQFKVINMPFDYNHARDWSVGAMGLAFDRVDGVNIGDGQAELKVALIGNNDRCNFVGVGLKQWGQKQVEVVTYPIMRSMRETIAASWISPLDFLVQVRGFKENDNRIYHVNWAGLSGMSYYDWTITDFAEAIKSRDLDCSYSILGTSKPNGLGEDAASIVAIHKGGSLLQLFSKSVSSDFVMQKEVLNVADVAINNDEIFALSIDGWITQEAKGNESEAAFRMIIDGVLRSHEGAVVFVDDPIHIVGAESLLVGNKVMIVETTTGNHVLVNRSDRNKQITIDLPGEPVKIAQGLDGEEVLIMKTGESLVAQNVDELINS